MNRHLNYLVAIPIFAGLLAVTTPNSSHAMGEGAIGEIVLEKGSKRLGEGIKRKYGEDSRRYKGWEKTHRLMFDTTGIKERNREEKERGGESPRKRPRRGITGSSTWK